MVSKRRGASERMVSRVDSASLLSDLDALVAPEWQTLPTQGADDEKEMELQARVKVAPHGAAAYHVAMHALWNNCPDALEMALGHARAEMQLMEQKLEFTRIRQDFVSLCTAFQTEADDVDYDASVHAEALLHGVAILQRRCGALIEAQPARQSSNLPGLVTRRDTMLLHSRIRDISMNLLELSKKKQRSQGSARGSGLHVVEFEVGDRIECASDTRCAAATGAGDSSGPGPALAADERSGGRARVSSSQITSDVTLRQNKDMALDKNSDMALDKNCGMAAETSAGMADPNVDSGRTIMHGIETFAPRVRRKGRLTGTLDVKGVAARGYGGPCRRGRTASLDRVEPRSEAREGGA